MIHLPFIYLFGHRFYIFELGPIAGAVLWPAEFRSGFAWPLALSVALFSMSVVDKNKWRSLFSFVVGLIVWYGSGLFFIAALA